MNTRERAARTDAELFFFFKNCFCSTKKTRCKVADVSAFRSILGCMLQVCTEDGLVPNNFYDYPEPHFISWDFISPFPDGLTRRDRPYLFDRYPIEFEGSVPAFSERGDAIGVLWLLALAANELFYDEVHCCLHMGITRSDGYGVMDEESEFDDYCFANWQDSDALASGHDLWFTCSSEETQGAHHIAAVFKKVGIVAEAASPFVVTVRVAETAAMWRKAELWPGSADFSFARLHRKCEEDAGRMARDEDEGLTYDFATRKMVPDIATVRRRRFNGVLRAVVFWLSPARKRAAEVVFHPDRCRLRGDFD